MFPQVDSLPGSQNEPVVCDGDTHVVLREDRSNMGGHIVGAFRRMRKSRVTVSNQMREELFEVSTDGGICILAKNE